MLGRFQRDTKAVLARIATPGNRPGLKGGLTAEHRSRPCALYAGRRLKPQRLRAPKPERTREHLTEAEVERLIKATRDNRYGHRDATMILVAYRHGLRTSKLTDLRWDQIDFRTGTLHVRRAKQGTPNTHPILGDELRALRRLHREQEPKSPFVFTSERGSSFTSAGFARIGGIFGSIARQPLT